MAGGQSQQAERRTPKIVGDHRYRDLPFRAAAHGEVNRPLQQRYAIHVLEKRRDTGFHAVDFYFLAFFFQGERCRGLGHREGLLRGRGMLRGITRKRRRGDIVTGRRRQR